MILVADDEPADARVARRRYRAAHRAHRGRRRHVKRWIAREDFREFARNLQAIEDRGGLVILNVIL